MPRQLLAVSGIVLTLLAALRAGAQTTQPVDLPRMEGASVSVPWDQIRPLLERRPSEPAMAPVDYVFSSADYNGAVNDQTAAVTAAAQITVLNRGWSLVPLGPAAGIVKVTADGQPAPLVMRDGQMFLLLQGQGTRKLDMTLETPIRGSAAAGSIELPLLPSPIATIHAALSGTDLDVTADAADVKTSPADKGTMVMVTTHGGQPLTLSWKPKVAAAPQQPQKITAETATLVSVDRGVLRCRADVDFTVLHVPVQSLRLSLPDGAELVEVKGPTVRDAGVAPDDKMHTVVVNLNEPTLGHCPLTIEYETVFKEDQDQLSVGLLTLGQVTRERGSIGIEAAANYQVTPTAVGAQRVDVRELPPSLWDAARRPLLAAFRYDATAPKLTLALQRHEDMGVLVAMSDVCEAATTYTPDGKSVTKMMFVLRNNRKQFMTLKLPEGAQIWSTFVNDHPVVPLRGAPGEVLIPLVKSEEVSEFDMGDSYQAKREQRRNNGLLKLHEARARDDQAPDLKPYDVEVVFVSPVVKYEDRGQINAALPQSDIPCGQMAWAIFLPTDLRVVDTQGNFQEVERFSLPFRHFAEVAAEKAQHELDELKQAAMQEQQQLTQAQRAKEEGVLPVRIEIPVTGTIHRFEKVLVVDEAPTVAVTYRRTQ